MTQLPAYFLKQPPHEISPATIAGFERLYRQYVAPGNDTRSDTRSDAPNAVEIPYDLDAPKWQFLCYLCDHKNILLHGSGARDIGEFEPRQPHDTTEFGSRLAVYAASDGLWPIYFAIVDRPQVKFLVNACFRMVEADGIRSEPYYYFAIDRDALANFPWRDGMMYLLPSDTFEPQPLQDSRGVKAEIAQWVSPVAVRPLARLAVTPADFPFLNDVYGCDPDYIFERSKADPDGFPWREDPAQG